MKSSKMHSCSGTQAHFFSSVFFFLSRAFLLVYRNVAAARMINNPINTAKENAPSIYLKGTHRKGSAEEFKWINFPLLMRDGVWMLECECHFCV